MPSDFDAKVALEATVAPSEDPGKVIEAVRNVVGGASHAMTAGESRIRIESTAPDCLDRLHDQLRDRRVRGAARKRLAAGRDGNRTTVLLNRQAASAGVFAFCDSEEESPLGPIYMTIECEDLEGLIKWLTDYPPG